VPIEYEGWVNTTAVRGFWEVMYFKLLIETSTKSYVGEVGKGDIEIFKIYFKNKYYEMVALANSSS
jgi:hypothetical protein